MQKEEKFFSMEDVLKFSFIDLVMTTSRQLPYLQKSKTEKDKTIDSYFSVMEKIRKLNVQFDKLKYKIVPLIDYNKNTVTVPDELLENSIKKLYVNYSKTFEEVMAEEIEKTNRLGYNIMFQPGYPEVVIKSTSETKPTKEKEEAELVYYISELYFFELRKGHAVTTMLEDIVTSTGL